MKTQPTVDKASDPATYKTYVVDSAADDGHRVYCNVYTASADRAKELACRAELAPPNAALSIRPSEFEEAGR